MSESESFSAGACILVINCGSSSLKFALIAGNRRLADGVFERLGSQEAKGKWCFGDERSEAGYPNASHEEALIEVVRILERRFGQPLPVQAVGHRVVHGGEFFRDARKIDGETLRKIEKCRELAPLHNPANLLGIGLAERLFPSVPHVAVFDTAFHQTLPDYASLYAIPYEMYERYGVRRYGFHGTSHEYVSGKAAWAMGKPLEGLHLITAHLGNGCSACAVREGKSMDTTMGLTPLEGLVMGTRSGDVDPDLGPFLGRVAQMSPAQVSEMLNRRSGLLGISGLSNDMRTVSEAAADGDRRAVLALEIFCYRLAKAVLALSASLDRIDALIFTGGIGENSAIVRQKTLSFLRVLGPEVDPSLNASHGRGAAGRITRESSRLLCQIVPTNEEQTIVDRIVPFL